MANKKYSSELKIEVVRRYIAGESPTMLMKEFKLSSKNRVFKWHKIYKDGNITFRETRGRISKKHDAKKSEINISEMSKDEYIEYLEMENDILKYLAALNQE